MLRLHAASSSCTQHVTLRLHAASSSCTQHVMLRLHAASSSCTQHVMLRLHAAASSCTQHVMLRLHAAASSCTQHVMLRLHAASSWHQAWMTAGKHLGIKCYHQVSHQRKEFCRSLSEVDPKLSKKAGTQVIDRKWKALKDFLPSNYHRKINGPHGSQVNPLMRKRVFQFCWRNSLQSPSPAQFLKHLAKLQCKKKCSGVSFQDDENLPPLPDVWFPMGRIPG